MLFFFFLRQLLLLVNMEYQGSDLLSHPKQLKTTAQNVGNGSIQDTDPRQPRTVISEMESKWDKTRAAFSLLATLHFRDSRNWERKRSLAIFWVEEMELHDQGSQGQQHVHSRAEDQRDKSGDVQMGPFNIQLSALSELVWGSYTRTTWKDYRKK